MDLAQWFISAGVLLIVMVIIATTLSQFSVSVAIIFFLIGVALGNTGLGALTIQPLENASSLRLLTEIAVIISLFTTGLKLRLPLSSPQWKTPLLLATVSMLMAIFTVACVAYITLDLSIGGAVLLGAILAPTDPVLASSVQVAGPGDQDRLRFSLTAEAGLNDGTAFPFVLLGLGLLGLRELGEWGIRWIFLDLLWGTLAGLAIGTCLATLVGRLIGMLRTVHKETSSYDDFLALGLIALSYGVAIKLHAYGFLAVFAAGLALRRRERQEADAQAVMGRSVQSPQACNDSVSKLMAQSLLRFNERMDHICELVVVVVLGAMVTDHDFSFGGFVIAGTLILVARPLSVLLGVRIQSREHRLLLAWFGIRGIGSLYYLAFVLEHDLAPELARLLIGVTLTVVVVSVFVHGLSSARLMIRHDRKVRERG